MKTVATRKNKSAQSLVSRRWQKSTAEERSAVAVDLNAAKYADKPPVPCTICGEPCKSVRAMYEHRRAAHNVTRGPKPKAI